MKTIQLEALQPTNTPNEARLVIPSSIGEGEIKVLTFRSGLRLMIVERQFNTPVTIKGGYNEHITGFNFCLKGRFDFFQSCLDQSFTASAGDSGFFSFSKSSEYVEKADNQRMIRIGLILDREHLTRLSAGDENRYHTVLKTLDSKSSVRIGDSTTPAMKAILYQILHCPYEGMTWKIFMEGKAMELFAHKMDQLAPVTNPGSSLKTFDKERIHYAARLLTADLENPPDINSLSRQVGINRNKLHRCFQYEFGVSPFEYLRNQRLHTAMQLLQSGEVNVGEASLMVGYTNHSYFSKAFKEMFGISPSQLRQPL